MLFGVLTCAKRYRKCVKSNTLRGRLMRSYKTISFFKLFENTIFSAISHLYPFFQYDLVYRRFKMGCVFSFETGPEQPIRSASYKFSFINRHLLEWLRRIPKFHLMMVTILQCFFFKGLFWHFCSKFSVGSDRAFQETHLKKSSVIL